MIRSVFVLAIVLLPVIAAADANPDKSPARDDIVLTKGAMSRLEKDLADKADWATDAKARERARTSIQMVEPGLKRIRTADPKWDLSAWDRTLAAAKARLAAADAALAKSAGDAKTTHDLYHAYVSAMTPLRGALELLAQLDAKPADVAIDSEQIFGKTVPTIASVKSLDELCKAKNLAALPVPNDYVGTKPSAVDGCKLAANGPALGKKYVELQAAGAAKREAQRLEKLMARAKAGEAIDVAVHHDLRDPTRMIAALKKLYDTAGQPFGATIDDAWYEPIRTVAADYPNAIAEAAKTSRFAKDATQQDAAIKAAIVGDYKGGDFEKGQVIKVGAFADWSVEKDYRDKPVSRSRSVVALIKIDGETFCRVYQRTFDEKYVNGAWSRPSGRGGASFQLSSCK